MSSARKQGQQDDEAGKETTPCRGRSTTPGINTPSANTDIRDSDAYEEIQISNLEESEQIGKRNMSPELNAISLASLSTQANLSDSWKTVSRRRTKVAEPAEELLLSQKLNTIQLGRPNTSGSLEVGRNLCTNCTTSVEHKRIHTTNTSKSKERRANYRDRQIAKIEAISNYHRRKSTVKEMATKSPNPKPYHRDNRDRHFQRNTKRDYQASYRLSPGRYCVACGQYSHDISDGCRLLCDDTGRLYPTVLTSAFCTNCYKTYGKELYHSRHLCPGRPAMMELYHSGKVKPSGVFRQTYEDWAKANAEESSKDCNLSGIKAATAEIIPNEPKDQVRDNITPAKEEERKLYLHCSGCMPEEIDCKYDYDVRMTALLDSATDKNIISARYYSKLFGIVMNDDENQLEESHDLPVTCADHKIPEPREVTLMIRPTSFSSRHYPILFSIVAEDHEDVAPMIIGLNGIRSLQLTWTPVTDKYRLAPCLYSILHPEGPLSSIFCSELELQLCTGVVKKIKAKETQVIVMNINHFFNLAPGTQVILSDDHISNENAGIKILPGQTQLIINDDGQLSGRALIINNSNHTITNTVITGYIESSDQSIVREVVVDFDFSGSFIYGLPMLPEVDESDDELDQLAIARNTPAIN